MEQKTVLETLSALAQNTRLEAFRCLVRAEPEGLSAGKLGEHLDISGPSLSFHLKELRHAGLVRHQRQGRSIVYRADLGAMIDLLGYLTQNCCRGEDGSTPVPVCERIAFTECTVNRSSTATTTKP